MKTNEMINRAADGHFIRPVPDTVAPVEPEDLSRFEGEGGSGAPVPAIELIDVPLDNAIWRRPRETAHQTNPEKTTP
jgi:hypothetical protein